MEKITSRQYNQIRMAEIEYNLNIPVTEETTKLEANLIIQALKKNYSRQEEKDKTRVEKPLSSSPRIGEQHNVVKTGVDSSMRDLGTQSQTPQYPADTSISKEELDKLEKEGALL